MVIFPQSLIASAAAAGLPLTNPRILYASHARDLAASAVTVSTEATDGPKDAPLRPDTGEYWQPTALPATWTVDLGAAKDIDAIGILGTFGSSGAAVEARISDEATNFDSYLSLPGETGDYASTPDSAAVSITGDIDIRAKIAPTSWADGTFQPVVIKGDHSEYGLFLSDAGSTLALYWRSGGLVRTVTSSAHTFTAGQTKWVRATRVSSTGAVAFYHSDDGVTWTALGTGGATAGAADDSANALNIGLRDGTGQDFAGRIYYVEIRNGIDGPVVARFNPDDATSDGATSFTAGTGEVWTINQSGTPKATLVVRRFASAVSPADDAPILFLDALRSKRYLRLNVTGGSVMPKLSVFQPGQALSMEGPVEGPYTPITMDRETVLHNVLSKGGQFLGQGFRRHGVSGDAAFKYLSAAWVRASFNAFSKSARSLPYFFAWCPQHFPTEIGYCWSDKDIVPRYMGRANLMEVSWKMFGVGNE